MLTKTDFAELEKRFVTKGEFKSTVNGLIELITVFRADFELFKEEMIKFREEMREFREEMRDITSNHEHRLDRFEDKVFN